MFAEIFEKNLKVIDNSLKKKNQLSHSFFDVKMYDSPFSRKT